MSDWRFGSIELWPRQIEAVQAIDREFELGRQSTLLLQCTGTGKTKVFGAITVRRIARGQRVLIICNIKELVDQAASTLREMHLDPAIEQGERRAEDSWGLFGEPKVVVATVQSLHKKRLSRWPKDYFGLIVTDECDYSVADSFRAIYKHFDQADHLGVTATADRADGEPLLGTIFESVAYRYELRQAVLEGKASRIIIRRCKTGIDLRGIKKKGKDLDPTELAIAMVPHLEVLANAARQEMGDRRTIAFMPDVFTSDMFAAAMRNIGVNAYSINNRVPLEQQEHLLGRFARGEIQAMVACQMLGRGYDNPAISCVIMGRPTGSRALYAQWAGRGTRVWPGKENMLLVDFTYNTGKHELVNPVLLYAEDGCDVEALKEAEKLVDSHEQEDLLLALEAGKERRRQQLAKKAAEDLEAEKQNRPHKETLPIQKRDVLYRAVEYDPFLDHSMNRRVADQAMDELENPEAYRDTQDDIRRAWETHAATPKQVNRLKKMGIRGAEKMTKGEAGRILGQMFQRFEKKLATPKMVSFCIDLGMKPEQAGQATFAEAKEFLDAHAPRRAPKVQREREAAEPRF